MRTYIQAGLAVLTILTLLWSLALLIKISDPHGLAALGGIDTAATAVLATSLLGLSLIALVAAQNPRADIVYSVAVTLLLICAAAAFHMLKTHDLALSVYNVLSLIVALAVGAYLIVAQRYASGVSASPSRRTAAPAVAIPKRTVGAKKAVTKTANKAVKKGGKKTARKKAAKKSTRSRRQGR